MTPTLDLAAVPELLLATFGAAAAAIVVTVAMVRLYGLRSLAKFAPHDFVVTVALGSVIAATAARSVSLWAGLFGLAGLFLVQGVLSRVRRAGGTTVVDNDPLLLMAGGRVLWRNLDTGGVTVSDLRAKLREANVLRLDEVQAVVLEGTGDISVLHGAGRDLDPVLLEDVRGLDEAAAPATWTPGQHDSPPFRRPA